MGGPRPPRGRAPGASPLSTQSGHGARRSRHARPGGAATERCGASACAPHSASEEGRDVSALGSLAGVVGVGVVVAIFGVEARGWLARLSRWVTRRAVQRFPETQRARYEQEWPAELDELLKERPVSAVLWAVGYFVTASKVASVREGTTPARIKTPWGHNERLRVRYSDLQQRAVVDGWTIT